MGGTIAYEVAQRFEAAGEPVALLALFDTMNWHPIPPGDWKKVSHALERVFFHAASFSSLSFTDQRKFVGEKWEALQNRIPVWRGMLRDKFARGETAVSSDRILGRVWRTNDQACWNYIAQPYPGIVTDFRPAKQYRIYRRPDVKWDTLALRGQRVVNLPVYPAGMLVEPFVQQLAAALKESIDSAMDGSATVSAAQTRGLKG